MWTITGDVKSIVCLADKFPQLYTDLSIRSRSKLLKMTRNSNGRLRIFKKISRSKGTDLCVIVFRIFVGKIASDPIYCDLYQGWL